MGPIHRLAKRRACKRGDDFAKQAAASKTNGVVGNPGSTAPKTANTKQINPANTSDARRTRKTADSGDCSAGGIKGFMG